MNLGWQIDSSICTAGFIVERIGQNLRGRVFIPKADGRQRPLGVAALNKSFSRPW